MFGEKGKVQNEFHWAALAVHACRNLVVLNESTTQQHLLGRWQAARGGRGAPLGGMEFVLFVQNTKRHMFGGVGQVEDMS